MFGFSQPERNIEEVSRIDELDSDGWICSKKRVVQRVFPSASVFVVFTCVFGCYPDIYLRYWAQILTCI